MDQASRVACQKGRAELASLNRRRGVTGGRRGGRPVTCKEAAEGRGEPCVSVAATGLRVGGSWRAADLGPRELGVKMAAFRGGVERGAVVVAVFVRGAVASGFAATRGAGRGC